MGWRDLWEVDGDSGGGGGGEMGDGCMCYSFFFFGCLCFVSGFLVFFCGVEGREGERWVFWDGLEGGGVRVYLGLREEDEDG